MRKVKLLHEKWKFHEGDIDSRVSGHRDTYMASKSGHAPGAAHPDFDDSLWPVIDLPHDWAVAQPFDPEANLSQGYKKRGVGWYRRRFLLDTPQESTRRVILSLDGVATHCTVWINGIAVARHFCGYTGLTVDITDLIIRGAQPNVIAVRVDAQPVEGWWYEGAGIYRSVSIIETPPVHFAPESLHVLPVAGLDGQWTIDVQAALTNVAAAPAQIAPEITILDPAGRQIAHVALPAQMISDPIHVIQTSLSIESPLLWDIDEPHLYTCQVSLCSGDQSDAVSTRFGLRTIEFHPEKGFFLNGRALKLKGTCNHQDHAGVGVDVPKSLHSYRIKRLQSLGSNAYRCAHNPPSRELLDACDEEGMLVIDETRHFSSAPDALEDLRYLVRRDRNHPCIIAWCILNEEPHQATDTGRLMAQRMVREIRALDPSRPITAALNYGFLSNTGVHNVVDIMGFNYAQSLYDEYHAKHPGQALLATESCCAFATRGCAQDKPSTHYFSNLDTQAALWGDTAAKSWREIIKRPFVAGTFVWTGLDYKGEPTPHQWPSVSSHWGILDSCGFDKDIAWCYRAMWCNEPVLWITPHWNHDLPGELVTVKTYTNCAAVELLLNGVSLGAKPVEDFHFPVWEVPYTPGTLKAIGYDAAGKCVSQCVRETTGPLAALKIDCLQDSVLADGQETLALSVIAVDRQGREVPTADVPVDFTCSGPGKIIGVGNGDPTSHEPDQASQRKLFHGRCQILVQSTGQTGQIILTAHTAQIAPAQIIITSIPLPAGISPLEQFAPVADEVILGTWQVSPVIAQRPDPSWAPSENDMNSWATVDLSADGKYDGNEFSGGYRLYRTAFQRQAAAVHAYTLELSGISGCADLYINGSLTHQKKTIGTQPAIITLPLCAEGKYEVTLLFDSQSQSAGLQGICKAYPKNEKLNTI